MNYEKFQLETNLYEASEFRSLGSTHFKTFFGSEALQRSRIRWNNVDHSDAAKTI